MAIRGQQSLRFPAIVPTCHLQYLYPGPLIDHVLQGVGQEVLAEIGLRAQRSIDPLEQETVVAYIVEADVGQTRNGFLRLLDDPLHDSVLISHDHTEALKVLDLLRPDKALRLRMLRNHGQVRIKQRVHENDENGPADERLRQLDRSRRSVLNNLLNED